MAEGDAGRPSHDLCATSGWPGVVALCSHKDPVVQLTSETKKPNRILLTIEVFLSLNFLGQLVYCGPRLINKHNGFRISFSLKLLLRRGKEDIQGEEGGVGAKKSKPTKTVDVGLWRISRGPMDCPYVAYLKKSSVLNFTLI